MSDDLLATVKAEHELKCWPEYFQAVLSGDKPFEVRNNDRDFKVGDTLWLREWHPFGTDAAGYTGAELRLRVTYMLEGPAFGIAAGYVVMGLESRDLSALRQRHAELAPHLDHLCAMYAAGAPRPGGQQVQPPAEAISQPTLRRLVRPIVASWLAPEARKGVTP